MSCCNGVVNGWDVTVPGGKLAAEEQIVRQEPRKQAENPR
jgi:hypothetical protein